MIKEREKNVIRELIDLHNEFTGDDLVIVERFHISDEKVYTLEIHGERLTCRPKFIASVAGAIPSASYFLGIEDGNVYATLT